MVRAARHSPSSRARCRCTPDDARRRRRRSRLGLPGPAQCASTAAVMPPPLRSKTCSDARIEFAPAAKTLTLQYAAVGVSRGVERVVQTTPDAIAAPSHETDGVRAADVVPPSSRIVAETNSGLLVRFTT